MKSINRHYIHKAITACFSLLLIILSCTVISSCNDKDDDDNATPVTVDKGTVLLHLHNYIDDSDIGELPGLTNTDNNGRDISISKASFYISEIQLTKLDGTVYSFPGKRVLKVFENVLYEVGEIPVGNYNTVSFKIGLDASTNALNPSASADSAILNKPEMWFGSTAQPDGYVFMNLQGTIDTSASHTEAPVPFIYKIGTNAHYHQVTVNGINLTIVKDQAQTAHMVADYNKLFSGISIGQSSNLSLTTVAENNSALATSILNNLQLVFKPE